MISGQVNTLCRSTRLFVVLGITACLLASCKSKPKITETMKTNDTAPGTFGYDL